MLRLWLCEAVSALCCARPLWRLSPGNRTQYQGEQHLVQILFRLHLLQLLSQTLRLLFRNTRIPPTWTMWRRQRLSFLNVFDETFEPKPIVCIIFFATNPLIPTVRPVVEVGCERRPGTRVPS